MEIHRDYSEIIHRLKHYLPTQQPLKDFIHHNTLHAFQGMNFHQAMMKASKIFGYQTYRRLDEYREAFFKKQISELILEDRIRDIKGDHAFEEWKGKLLHKSYDDSLMQRIDQLRKLWKERYSVNPDKYVYPILFRTIGNFLDQGIAVKKPPYTELPLLESLRTLERSSFISLFKTPRAQRLLLAEDDHLLSTLLEIVVGDNIWAERYLFDQQFAHPGWSGMVAVLEHRPDLLLDRRLVSLHDFICFELLLEIDALDQKFGEVWKPLSMAAPNDLETNLFTDIKSDELFEVYQIWQEAYEWSYYDLVLKGLQMSATPKVADSVSFQAIFCIDDRECSIRRNIEAADSACETFGTAGFFNIPIYFQPEESKFFTKVCPAPMTPSHLIKEQQSGKRHQQDIHFSKTTNGLLGGILSAPTMGFWSAIQLGVSILFPRPTAAMVSSSMHMDPNGKLSIEYTGEHEKGLQVGFTIEEMADKIEGLLKGIGLTKGFAPLVYIIGHGASSTNNTHYAGYDCGACSGRAGSVNARVAAYMANKAEVKQLLRNRGIDIPEITDFAGGLHDTTRDEITFYDEDCLRPHNRALHEDHKRSFETALKKNAVERSQRFMFVDSQKSDSEVHKKVVTRSLSMFEPRPEWNHATNALCIVGNREVSKKLFLDRRAFLNSYDYREDPEGNILLSILNAVSPVCGGINLEYYFSKVDNHRLGAGSKLPHNVMGLIGVANGMEGDLRTGLPLQMINIHEPLRLLVIIEQSPELIQRAITSNEATFEWYKNSWIHLASIDPETRALSVFRNGAFLPYRPFTEKLETSAGTVLGAPADSEHYSLHLIS